ncbi:efflux transporter outer membrane subunit [Sulfurimonas sp. HSL-1656]|uniref:efflux transporter outer membrane subunit n=1 Tax=Thiomicrolovo subterrani TaxID=3131934 RepID=UPI0031F9361E
MNAHKLLSLAAALWLLGGCSMAPKLTVTPPELPDQSTASADTNASTIGATWWKAFNDATLDALVEEALQNNDDLKIAASRVAQAAASLGFSRAERYPTLDGGASANRQKTSGETLSPFSGFIYNSYDLSVTAAYELDFWGKYKNLEAAARGQLIATDADRETVRIGLIAGVAELYFNLVSLRRQITVTEETVQAYKESYEYRARQFQHGAIDELTLQQSHALYATAKVALASLREEHALAENAMGILLGRSPKALLEAAYETVNALPEPQSVPADLTSRLLERRPDILAAESRLRTANATIGVAKAAYFPTISLTGTAGYSSSELDNLLNASAQMWGLGAALYVPLFDFGRIENSVREAEAKKDEAVTVYAKTVKVAFKEVYDALAKIRAADEKLTAQEEANTALEKVLSLSQRRFDSGYGTYLEVIDAKRLLLASRLNLVQLSAARITNQISLYKALGGGWERARP